jgi:hypothetical protein
MRTPLWLLSLVCLTAVPLRTALAATEEPTAPPTPAPQVEPLPAAVAPVAPAPLKPELTFGGGALLWFYQPFTEGSKNSLSLYAAYFDLDAKLGAFAFHLEPRVRIGKLRSFFPGNVWVQEAYASWSAADLTVKVGKVYSRLGGFWDDSFYGNLLYFDGIKLDPDYGASVEGTLGKGQALSLNYDAQLFLVDGETNGSLPGRDTISVGSSRRRNEAVVRVQSGYRFSEKVAVSLGLSGQYFRADLEDLGPQDVWRGAVDVSLSAGPVTAFGEYVQQRGRSVSGFPVAPVGTSGGEASALNDYFWAGAAARFGRVTARYNLSLARYRDLRVSELMHQPGVSVTINELVTVMGEVALWSRTDRAATSTLDRSLNLVLDVHY